MSSINASQVLETKPVGKLLLQYSIPEIIGMTVTSLYNIIDSVFIGHGVGPLAISGLAITFPLMNLIIAFSTLVGIGGATISSIYLGQKDTEKTNSVLGNVLLLCMINGFCFGGLTLIFLDPILHFFGASPATLPYARDFMQVILMGNPIAFTIIGLNNVMRATGYPKKAMLSSLLTVFANIILADEINRATPRTQASLLECMEERQVTVDGVTRKLAEPFFVIATQNPLETTGTFPLPEAQLDRFFMKLSMGLPDKKEEVGILKRFILDQPYETLQAVCKKEQILAAREQVKKVHVHELLLEYMADLVQATRKDKEILSGVRPRGTMAPLRASQAYAWIRGRDYVVPEDIKTVAGPVMAHRLV